MRISISFGQDQQNKPEGNKALNFGKALLEIFSLSVSAFSFNESDFVFLSVETYHLL